MIVKDTNIDKIVKTLTLVHNEMEATNNTVDISILDQAGLLDTAKMLGERGLLLIGTDSIVQSFYTTQKGLSLLKRYNKDINDNVPKGEYTGSIFGNGAC